MEKGERRQHMNVRKGIWVEGSREMKEDKNLKLKEAGTF